MRQASWFLVFYMNQLTITVDFYLTAMFISFNLICAFQTFEKELPTKISKPGPLQAVKKLPRRHQDTK